MGQATAAATLAAGVHMHVAVCRIPTHHLRQAQMADQERRAAVSSMEPSLWFLHFRGHLVAHPCDALLMVQAT